MDVSECFVKIGGGKATDFNEFDNHFLGYLQDGVVRNRSGNWGLGRIRGFFRHNKNKAPAAKEGQFLAKSAGADLIEKNRSGPPRKDFKN
jgi:hypothetical protein